MLRKKEKEKMLLFTEENKKGVVSVCDSIMSRKELSVKQIEDTYLFMVEAGCEIERKIKMVLEIVYPSVWKCFYVLSLSLNSLPRCFHEKFNQTLCRNQS